MTAFDTLASALATVLGVAQSDAGWLMGIFVIIVLLTAMGLALGKSESGSTYLLFSGMVGAVINVVVGWWPLWTMLVLALLVAWLIMGPFRQGASA